MARITLKTRLNGNMEFFALDSGGYARLESDTGHHGVLAPQICEGGGFRGSCLVANAATLPAVARRWYRAYRAGQRERCL